MKPTTIGMIAFLIIIILLAGAFRYADKPEMKVCTYTVQKGDTLWSLSRKYCPNEWDLRKWTWEVQKLNHLTTDEYLLPGAQIKILKKVKR